MQVDGRHHGVKHQKNKDGREEQTPQCRSEFLQNRTLLTCFMIKNSCFHEKRISLIVNAIGLYCIARCKVKSSPETVGIWNVKKGLIHKNEFFLLKHGFWEQKPIQTEKNDI